MKKLFTSLLALTALLLFGSSNVWATVKIGGTTLAVGTTYTSSNCSAIKSGSAKLESENKLVLTNTSISVTSGDAVTNSTSNLYVIIEGSVSVTNSSSGQGDACFYLQANTIFTTNGGVLPQTLTLQNTGQGQAIRVYNASGQMYFYNLNLTAKSSNSNAIYSADGGGSVFFHYTKAVLEGGKNAILGFSTVGGTAAFEDSSYSFGSGGILKNGSLTNKATLYPYIQLGSAYINTTSSKKYDSSSTGTGISAGTLQYDRDTKTLTIDGLSTSGSLFTLRVPGLKVKCLGTNSITTSSGDAFRLYADTEFTGTGTLTVNASSSAFSTYNGCDVTFEMGDVTATGGSYGFYGQAGGTLYLEKPSSKSPKYKFCGTSCNVLTGNLEMTNIDIWTGYSWFNKEKNKMYYKNEVATKSNTLSGTWFASKDQFTYYDVWIAGTQLNSMNCDRFYSPLVTVGSVAFSSKTLTLNNVTISGQTGTDAGAASSAIYHSVEGLTINISGTNNLTTAGNTLELGGNTTIKGSGTLNITSTDKHGINMFNTKGLTLQLASGVMAVKAKKYAYYGYNTTNLTINKDGSTGAHYKFAGEEGNVYNTGLVMGTGVHIWTASNWYNAEKYAIYTKDNLMTATNVEDGTWIRGDVTWTEVPVSVAGEQLYYAPKSDGTYRGNVASFWNKYMKGGSLSYSPDTKTLTLNSANIELTEDKPVIQSYVDGLNIVASGTCNLSKEGTGNNAFLLYNNTNIKGSGTINLTASYCLKPMGNYNVTLSGGVKLIASGVVSGSNSKTGTLTVDNSTLDCSKLLDWSSVKVQNGSDYAIPNRGEYSSSSHLVKFMGDDYKGRVLIQPLDRYNVFVAGIEVNSYNKDNIFADPMYADSWGKSGSAQYLPATKTLTLTDVNITAPENKDAVSLETDNQIVSFAGVNTLKASGSGNAVWAKNCGTLMGTGVLNASNSYGAYPAIYAGNYSSSNFDFTISGLTVNTNGLHGQSKTHLKIQDATVNLTGFGDGTVKGFNDVTLEGGVMIMKPAGMTADDYDTSAKTFKKDGATYTGEMQFAVGDTYPLTIAGIEVTSANADNITGAGISGSVKYDNATKTLTLDNASITKTGVNGIRSEFAELNIELVGDNTINNGNSYASLYSTGNITISGSGSLTTSFIIQAKGNLTIDNTTVTAGGRLRGQAIGSSSKLTIKNSSVKVNTPSGEPITEWGSFELEGCFITTPSGVEFSSSNGGLIMDDSSPYTGNLVIEAAEDYGIRVAGVQIHSKNADDISGATGANGTMTVTRSGGKTTVTMNNFNVTGTDNVTYNVISFSDAAGDVTINLVGDNVITSTNPDDDGTIRFGNTVDHTYKITGSGKLTSNARFGIHGSKSYSYLSIDGTEVNIGMLYYFKFLDIKNSTVNLAGDNHYGTIEDVENILLTGCDFTSPSNAEFNASEHAVYADGDRVLGAISIQPMQKYGLTIAGVKVTDINASDILGDGKVSWDAMAARLTLNGAAFGNSSVDGLEIDGTVLSSMEISLVGENEIEGLSGINVGSGTCDITVTSSDGTGRLRINGTNNGVDNINRFTVRNAIVGVTADNIGVRGGTLDVQPGAMLRIAVTTGPKALDVSGVDLAANMVVADGAADGQMVAYGEDYGFTLSGKRVTSYLLFTYATDVYDPATKTLTMNNVNEPVNLINDACDGLTLNISGTNNVTSDGKPVITTDKPMTIEGTGSISMTSTGAPAINAKADITIKGGITVNISGTNAYDGNNVSTLHVDASVLYATGSDVVFKDMAGLDMQPSDPEDPNHVMITAPVKLDGEGNPTDVVAVYADGTVKLDGTPVSGETVIIDFKTVTPETHYGISIAGVDVTSGNADAITGSDITRGSVSYDAGTNTLTLNEATIVGDGIKSTTPDLIIRLIGENNISDAATAIDAAGNVRIYSEFENGTLNINATSAAIAANGGISIDKCLIIADGGERGIWGKSGATTLTIDNAAVRVKGTVASVSGISSHLFNGGTELATSGAAFNETTMQVEIDEAVATGWIDMSEFYKVYVGSTPITRSLVYEESGEIATGVTFNRITNTLTLTEATVDGIWKEGLQPLDIVVEGTNLVKSSTHGSGIEAPALHVTGSVSISPNTVGSTITFDGGDMNAAIALGSNSELVILSDAAVVTKGMKGIVGDGSATLSVTNATLMANATAQVITGLSALNMSGVGILVPQNAAFNASTGAVEIDGAPVAGQQIVIDPSADGIDGLAAGSTGSDIDAIYAVDGKKLGRAQSGVNIVRMKNGSVKRVLRK